MYHNLDALKTNKQKQQQNEIYSLTFLKNRSVVSGCQQDHVPSEIFREKSFIAYSWFLVLAVNPWHFLVCSCITLIPASVVTLFSLLCSFLFFL